MGRNVPLKAPIPLGWQQELQLLFDFCLIPTADTNQSSIWELLFLLLPLSTATDKFLPSKNPKISNPAAGLAAPGKKFHPCPSKLCSAQQDFPISL